MGPRNVAERAEARLELDTLRTEPDLWPNAVDEILRYDPPVLLTGRTAVRDTEIGGTRISAGSLVTTLLAGANRDPDVFADPDAFDVRRDARDQVGFGHGIHKCVGQMVAKLESEVMLQTWAKRIRRFEIAGEVEFHLNNTVRSFSSILVRVVT